MEEGRETTGESIRKKRIRKQNEIEMGNRSMKDGNIQKIKHYNGQNKNKNAIA